MPREAPSDAKAKAEAEDALVSGDEAATVVVEVDPEVPEYKAPLRKLRLPILPYQSYELNKQTTHYSTVVTWEQVGQAASEEEAVDDPVDVELSCSAFDGEGKLVSVCTAEEAYTLKNAVRLLEKIVVIPVPPVDPFAEEQEEDVEEDEEPTEKKSPMFVLKLEELPQTVRSLVFAVSNFSQDETLNTNGTLADVRHLHSTTETYPGEVAVVTYDSSPSTAVELAKEDILVAQAAADAEAATEAVTVSKRKQKEDGEDSTVADEDTKTEPATETDEEFDEEGGDTAGEEEEETAEEAVEEPKESVPSTFIYQTLTRSSTDANVWVLTAQKTLLDIRDKENFNQGLTTYYTEQVAPGLAAPVPAALHSLTLYRDAALAGSYNNKSLSPHERLVVKQSILKLQAEQGVGTLNLWGKIIGLKADYIVLYSVKTTAATIAKQFYYSVDGGLTFARTVFVDDWAARQCLLINSYFSGKPATTYKDPEAVRNPDDDESEDEAEESESEDESDQEFDNEDEEQEPEPEDLPEGKRKLTEAERLSFFVSFVDAKTAVVPKGAFVLDAYGKIVKVSKFVGLTHAASKKLSSYLVFNAPQNLDTVELLGHKGLQDEAQFLDSLEEGNSDIQGLWSVQQDIAANSVTLRNFLVPGYEFHLQINSSEFDGAYFGHGNINHSAAFQI